MLFGIIAGISWGLETFVLGIALSMTPFVSDEQALFLAPFVSTFLHDLCSAVYCCIYNGARSKLPDLVKALKSDVGKYIILAAIIGGPVGMTGYVLTIKYMGASIGAVASAVFPAIGAVLAFIFLKEKMQWYRWILLCITLLGVYGLSYSPDLAVSNFWLGIAGALMCSFGWGIEGVILAKCFKNPDVKNEYALQIRQTSSALIYAIIILPLIKGWGLTAKLFTNADYRSVIPVIALAALFASISYFSYYKAISKVGVSKAMALDISYVAWAMIFNLIFKKDYSILNPVTIICALLVVVCGILAATDFRKVFSKT